MHIYTYIYIYIYTHTYIYIYIYNIHMYIDEHSNRSSFHSILFFGLCTSMPFGGSDTHTQWIIAHAQRDFLLPLSRVRSREDHVVPHPGKERRLELSRWNLQRSARGRTEWKEQIC